MGAKEKQIRDLSSQIMSFEAALRKERNGKNEGEKGKVIKLGKNGRKGEHETSRSKDEKVVQNKIEHIDCWTNGKVMDEYRIIATQAQALERMIGGKGWK